MTGYTTYTTNTFDECLKDYQDISYLFHFLENNTSFTNILEIIPVNFPIITDNYKLPIISIVTSAATGPSPIEIIATINQTLFDLTTRYYGDISKVLQLIEDSSIDNINQIITGKAILINNSNVYNKSVIYYNQHNLNLTTGLGGAIRERSFNLSFNLSFD